MDINDDDNDEFFGCNDDDDDNKNDTNEFHNKLSLEKFDYNARAERFRTIGYHEGYNHVMEASQQTAGLLEKNDEDDNDDDDDDDDRDITEIKKTQDILQDGFHKGYTDASEIAYQIGELYGQQIINEVLSSLLLHQSPPPIPPPITLTTTTE